MSSIKAGTVADFANSMAAAMENALIQEYKLVKGEDMPLKPDQDRHLLFVAIAQGVVSHLIDNLDAIEINVTTTQDEGNLIKSENDSRTIDVTQRVDGDNNLVKSTGTATLTIQTDENLY